MIGRRANSPNRTLVAVATSFAIAVVMVTSPAVAAPSRPSVVAAAAPSHPIRWLAVGDSYSAGEGLPDVSEQTCQRADRQGGHASAAWAQVAFERLSASGGGVGVDVANDAANRRGFDFEACTGAVTEDLFNNAGGKQEWSLQGNGQFDLVSFSFGGNNVGFDTTVYQCLGLSVQGAEAAVTGATLSTLAGGNPVAGAVSSWLAHAGCPPESDLRAAIDRLAGSGNDVKGRQLPNYVDFLRRISNTVVNPGGNIVVTGYPNLVEDPQFWPNINKVIGTCQGIRERDALTLRSAAGYLNQTIGSAVATVNEEHPNGVSLTFVDVNTGQPDHGVPYGDSNLYEPNSGDRHALCARAPWLNGFATTGIGGGTIRVARSFHPTQDGQDAMGALITARVRTLDWANLKLPPHPQPPPESFYEDWGVHGGGATFNPDGTGTAFGHNGFTDDGRWINEVQTLSTKLSADGQILTITIIEDHWEANGVTVPNPYPQYPPGFVAGDTFTARFEQPHLLNVTPLKTTNPAASLGNPYLCGAGFAGDQQICGA